jgi:hypothetical protein
MVAGGTAGQGDTHYQRQGAVTSVAKSSEQRPQLEPNLTAVSASEGEDATARTAPCRGGSRTGARRPSTLHDATAGPGPRGAKTPRSPDHRTARPQPQHGHGPRPTPEPARAVNAKTDPNGREQHRTNFKVTQKLSNSAIKVQPETPT